MRRFVAGERIIYRKRHRGVSLLLLAGAVATVLAVQSGVGGFPSDGRRLVSVIYGLPLAVAAAALLLRERVWVIDRAAGTLLRVERGLLGRSSGERLLPLGSLRILTTSAPTPFPLLSVTAGLSYWIWIETPDASRLLFEGPLKGMARLREKVERLREDLGR